MHTWLLINSAKWIILLKKIFVFFTKLNLCFTLSPIYMVVLMILMMCQGFSFYCIFAQASSLCTLAQNSKKFSISADAALHFSQQQHTPNPPPPIISQLRASASSHSEMSLSLSYSLSGYLICDCNCRYMKAIIYDMWCVCCWQLTS